MKSEILIVCHATTSFGYGHVFRMARFIRALHSPVCLAVSGEMPQERRPDLPNCCRWWEWDGTVSSLVAVASKAEMVVVDCLEQLSPGELAQMKQVAPLALIDYRNPAGWNQARLVVIGYLHGLHAHFESIGDTWLVRGAPFILLDPVPVAAVPRSKEIIACFGGTDPEQSGPALVSYLAANPPQWPVTVLSPHLLNHQAGPVRCLSYTHELDALMSHAEIAIVAGGNVLFEAIQHGAVPIIWPQVDHQWITARLFAQAGCAVLPDSPVSAAGIWNEACRLSSADNELRKLRAVGSSLIDSQGPQRLTQLIRGVISGTINQTVKTLKAQLHA